MKAVRYTSYFFSSLFLLFVVASTMSAQTASRIKIWHPLPSGTSPGADAASPDPLQSTPDQKRQPKSQAGYFIEVDTTTAVTQAPLIVTTNADAGVGSLRWAIDSANRHDGLDYINFNIGGGGPQTITLGGTGLPEIVSPVVIDGTTQSGFAGDPMIELDGTNVSALYVGLKISCGSSTIRGLVINRFKSSAIDLTILGGNVIERNFIGTSMDGTDSLPNWGNGVVMFDSPNNRIGDVLATARNVISSNQYPNVAISGAGSIGNRVVGNYIGTDKDGLKDLFNYYPQSVGVLIELGASANIIGGLLPGEGNLISGHGEGNLWLEDPGTSFNVIQGNKVGTNVIASEALYNGRGVVIRYGASNNLVGHTTLPGRNIISGGVADYPGIVIVDPNTTGNVVQGNIVGIPPNSTYSFSYYDGIEIINAANNVIGGTVLGAGNWISGNARHGVVIEGSNATGNHIEGNLIGEPSFPGAPSLYPNTGSGIFIADAPGNVIGGSALSAMNTISANGQNGIVIRGDTATNNIVQGNFIGGLEDGASGISSFGNHGHGILLIASHNTIGGDDPVLGNTITFNGGNGIFDSTGSNNLIRKNVIFMNDNTGIDLAPRGLTRNDSLDADSGPNNLQNFPILDSASLAPGSIHIKGKLNSTPNTAYTIDFFSNEKRDPTFFGEGEMWIGQTTVSTNDAGVAPIDATILVNVPSTFFITATATDPDSNTSEFSRGLCLQDLDGDGILDCWETYGDGIDWNADGIIDLNLSAKGARPDHKDIFVEVDYMLNFQPATIVLPMVESAFAKVKNKYLNNPDGNNGINLIAELNEDDVPIPDAAWTTNWWQKFFAAKKQYFGTDYDRADSNAANILEAKRLVYRYCIFADRHGTNGNTGVAESFGGNDFMVTVGGWIGTTALDQAATFMHELGHSLGLMHGGADTNNYKPNYFSIMNYTWQLPQNQQSIGGFGWSLDYSPVALPTLVEDNLDESVGLNPQPGDFPLMIVPFNSTGNVKRLGLLAPGTAINWDGNADSSGNAVSTVDINYLDHDPPNTPSPHSVLPGYADWSNLKYNFRSDPEFPDPPLSGPFAAGTFDTTDSDEMNPQIHEFLKSLPPYGIVAPISNWPSDPTANIPVSTAFLTQSIPVIVDDAEGGAYIAWSSGSGIPSTSGIYAQRLDASGALQWRNNGAPVAIGLANLGLGDMIADGNGNFISSWLKNRTGSFDIMAQKMNRFGQPQWGDSGASVVTVINDPAYAWMRMRSDGQGGAIVVWTDAHTGTRSVYAQRIDASGLVQWTAGGVRINTTPYSSDDFQIVGDGSGGILVAWTDKRSGAGDIYMQRVNASGLVQWTTNGIVISNASGHQAAPVLASNGRGGAFVTWINYRSGGNDVYAQHVDSTGQTLWTANGIAVVSVAGSKASLGIVSDGSSGAILSWIDGRRTNYTDPYVQRIDSSGASLWVANGVAVCDTLGSNESTIISDNNRGAIVVFVRRLFQLNDVHIYAQRVDSSGSMLWARNGVPVSTAGGPRSIEARGSVTAVSAPSGGAIIAWEDGRSDTFGSGIRHIYAQNVTSSGGLGGGVMTGVEQSHVGQLPSQVKLLQNYPNPFNPSTIIRYELAERSTVFLKIYNVLGQEIASLVNGVQDPGERQIRFDANNLANGVYFYRLMATTVGKGITSVSVKKMLLIR